jgi:hypothetical protein
MPELLYDVSRSCDAAQVGLVGSERAVVGAPPLDGDVGDDVTDVTADVDVDELDAETVVVSDEAGCFELELQPAATNAQTTMARLVLIGGAPSVRGRPSVSRARPVTVRRPRADHLLGCGIWHDLIFGFAPA